MNRKTALISFTFFDIFATFAIWLGYHEICQVVTNISNSSDSVSFLNRIGVFFIAIMLPVVHTFALIDYFKPSLIAKRHNLINRALITFCIALFVVAFFISAGTKQYVENSGYLYCNDASGISVLFRTLVYTKDWETCNQLATDRRAKLGLPPRK